jgi:hypothetical protein
MGLLAEILTLLVERIVVGRRRSCRKWGSKES